MANESSADSGGAMVRLVGTGRTRGYFHGFAHRCVIAELAVDPRADLAGAGERLVRALAPRLLVLAGRDWPEGAAQSADPADTLVRALWHCLAGLLEQAGIPVAGEALVIGREDGGAKLHVALPALLPPATADALAILAPLVGAAALSAAQEAALDALLERLRRQAPLGNNTRHLLRAAIALGMPHQLLPQASVQIGWGRRARLFSSTTTDATPIVGGAFAKNKLSAIRMMRAAAIPVPESLPAPDVEAAVAAAGRIGYPVVVKPADQDQGAGVSAYLRDADAVRRGYAKARALSPNVMVEKHVEGNEYRLIVANGKLFWAFERAPARVIGDGVSTVAALVAAENRTRAAGPSTGLALGRIDFGDEADEALAIQDLDRAGVPAAGRVVRLQIAPRMVGGGDMIAVFDRVHPDNAVIAERAARALRLDIAGIDLLIPDISVSWRENGGRITEVNPGPQFSPFSRADIYHALLRDFVRANGRVPVALVLGEGLSAEQVRAGLAGHGLCAGTAAGGRIVIGADLIADAASDLSMAAGVLTGDPTVAAIVLASDGAQIAREGLPLDRIDVLAVSEAMAASPELPRLLGLIGDHLDGEALVAEGNPALAEIGRVLGAERVRTVTTLEPAIAEALARRAGEA